MNTLTKFLLPVAMASALTACGGGGYGGDDNPPPAPAPAITVADAQFAAEKIEGLGFRGNGITEGRTDAAGKLKFGVGQTVEFFLGEGANRLIIGSATVAHGRQQWRRDDRPEGSSREYRRRQRPFLDNVISLLVSLDANSDASDGIRIDAATNTAIATAITGKTLDFGKAADAFKTDPVIVALFGALNRTFARREDGSRGFLDAVCAEPVELDRADPRRLARGRGQSPEELGLRHPRPRDERGGRRGAGRSRLRSARSRASSRSAPTTRAPT